MSSTPSVTPQPPGGGPPAAPPSSGGGAKIVLWIVGGIVGFGALCIIGVMVVGYMFVHKARQFVENPGYAIVKLAIQNNPDVQILSSNDSAGTMVVRDKKTGQVLTMKFDADKKSMIVTDEHGKTATMQLDPNKHSLVMTDDQGKTASMQLDPTKNSLTVTDTQGKTATVTADAQAGNMEIKSADGTLKIGANTDKAPDWVPVYPGSNPQGSLSATTNNEQTGTYVFVTQDPVDKVLNYYGSALKSAGMTTSNTTNNTDGKLSGIVSGQDDGKKRSVLVTAGGDKDGTHVSVSFGSKQ